MKKEEEFSVGALAQLLKKTLETTFGRVRVRGEISGSKLHTSGHLYFALKDQHAVLDSVCWRPTRERLSLQPEDGMEVICTGRITTYAGRSKYQLVVEGVTLAGQGAILKLLEERKTKLQAEGLFDSNRKKALPFLPTCIGIITSPTGAVFHDILHRLNHRFPRTVVFWPVLVQGEGAAAEITQAITEMNRLCDNQLPRIDVLIVARGGGSLEDLWAFNEESVVRAIAQSQIPIISAIGHETDITLADFAADCRAPTPTAAGEMVVPTRKDLKEKIRVITQRLETQIRRCVQTHHLKTQILAQQLLPCDLFFHPFYHQIAERSDRLHIAQTQLLRNQENRCLQVDRTLRPPHHLLEKHELTLRACLDRLHTQLRHILEHKSVLVKQQASLLDSNSYHSTLKRGFCLVTQGLEKPVTCAQALPPGTCINLHFWDGSVQASCLSRELSKK